jgi:hypothetical protein
LLVALLVLLLSTLIAGSEAKVTGTTRNLENTLSAGSMRLANSKSGTTVISANGLMPAGSASGTLTLSVQGDYSAAQTVTNAGISDTPASPALSQALTLLIEDITGTAKTLWSGTMSSFSSVSVGTFATGTTRTLRFTVTLPSGSAVPGLQNASTTMTLRFTGVGQ